MGAARNYGSVASERLRLDDLEANDREKQPQHAVHTTRRTFVAALLGTAFVILAVGYLKSSTVLANGNSPLVYAANNNAKDADAVDSHTATAALSPPTQVHVALADLKRSGSSAGNSLGVTVSWATTVQTNTSSVRFGASPSDLSSVVHATTPCDRYQFCTYTSPWLHHVEIPSSALKPSSTYYYQCGSTESGWSEVASFRTPAAVGSRAPITVGVIGDLGQTEYSQQTLRHLASRTDMSAIIHAGDLSYADSDQIRWDSWADLVQPLASTMPWMVSAGNHEKESPCQREVDPFVAYQKRFRMPFDPLDSLQRGNLYFAFRTGMVHFVVVTPYVAFDAASNQYKWLEQELSERVDRSVTPWVCVLMHGPWYNSNTVHQEREEHVVMKQAMEQVLFDHRVDLVFSGHVHAYERSFPVFKEQVREDGTIYVVLGGGGNREGLASTFIEPQPAWSAFRMAHYGFGLFTAVNATHGVIEAYENQAVGGAKLQDSAWVTTTAFRVETQLTHALPKPPPSVWP